MNTMTLIDQSNQFTFEDVSDMQGFEYPTVINSIGDISGKGGAVYLASKFGRRRLAWQGLLKSDVLLNRRALELACRAGRLKTLRFQTCDGLDLQVQIEVERITMPYKLGRTKYLIEAVAPDWRFLSQDFHSIDVTETMIIGGVDIPADIPMEFEVTEANTTIITNLGTEYAEPVFTVSGPGTRFIFQNKTTGEEFVVTQTLAEGEFITIRTDTPEVLLNGVTPIYGSLTGTFWKLPPGANEVALIAIASGPTTKINVGFNDAFLGI